MTGTEAIAAVRASTHHDADTQVTDAQILVKVALEYRRLRRVLQGLVPSLYESVTAPTIAAGASTISKPTATDRVWLLERLVSGTDYYPVPVAPAYNRNEWPELCWHETPTTLKVMPETDAPGTYRLTVIASPSATFVGATAIDVPEGCEDIIVEHTAAWVRQRHKESSVYHTTAANAMWAEQRPMLVRRYGAHPQQGLMITRW